MVYNTHLLNTDIPCCTYLNGQSDSVTLIRRTNVQKMCDFENLDCKADVILKEKVNFLERVKTNDKRYNT